MRRLDQELAESFAAAYAKGVIGVMTTHCRHEVLVDDQDRFYAAWVQGGTSPTDSICAIGFDWLRFVGPVGVDIDPLSPEYSEAILAEAIAIRLIESGTADLMAKALIADRDRTD